jgi:hypothetical protein
MKEIFYGKIGRIVKGKHENWFIKIEDDRERTGGYYVLICKTNFFDKNVYDDWLENYDDLKQYFLEKKWEIEWQ